MADEYLIKVEEAEGDLKAQPSGFAVVETAPVGVEVTLPC
jgi:hypothetical protein